jgi:hypothetical protein
MFEIIPGSFENVLSNLKFDPFLQKKNFLQFGSTNIHDLS